MLKNYLIVFFWSMVPLVELRGAIPIAHGINALNPDFNLFCKKGSALGKGQACNWKVFHLLPG